MLNIESKETNETQQNLYGCICAVYEAVNSNWIKM